MKPVKVACMEVANKSMEVAQEATTLSLNIRARPSDGDGLNEGAILVVVLVILLIPAAIVAAVVYNQQKGASKAGSKYQSFEDGGEDRVIPIDSAKDKKPSPPPQKPPPPSGTATVPAKPPKAIVHKGFVVGGKHETTNVVKYREEPDPESKVVGKLRAQTPITILEIAKEDPSRAKIKAQLSNAEVECWINLWTAKGALVVTKGEKGFRAGEVHEIRTTVKMREGEKSDTTVTNKLKPGTTITITKIGKDASRALVQTPDGVEGWISLWTSKGDMTVGKGSGAESSQPVLPATGEGILPGQVPVGFMDEEDTPLPSEAESDAGSEACRSLGDV